MERPPCFDGYGTCLTVSPSCLKWSDRAKVSTILNMFRAVGVSIFPLFTIVQMKDTTRPPRTTLDRTTTPVTQGSAVVLDLFCRKFFLPSRKLRACHKPLCRQPEQCTEVVCAGCVASQTPGRVSKPERAAALSQLCGGLWLVY